MKRQRLQKAIDLIGKVLLVWFIFETFSYFYSGLFLAEIKMLPRLFENSSSFFGLYKMLQIPVAAIGVFILIPLLLKGHLGGLLLGLLYWIMGNVMNPLWFIVPINLQITPENKATTLLHGINYFWAALTLLIIIAFYFHRRSLRTAQQRSIVNATT